MNYVWTKKEEDLLNPARPSYLYARVKTKMSLGDRVYVNSDGYAQKRRTDDYVGRCLTTHKETSVSELIKLENRVKEIINRQYGDK